MSRLKLKNAGTRKCKKSFTFSIQETAHELVRQDVECVVWKTIFENFWSKDSSLEKAGWTEPVVVAKIEVQIDFSKMSCAILCLPKLTHTKLGTILVAI